MQNWLWCAWLGSATGSGGDWPAIGEKLFHHMSVQLELATGIYHTLAIHWQLMERQ
jgi:hypothetical protein